MLRGSAPALAVPVRCAGSCTPAVACGAAAACRVRVVQVAPVGDARSSRFAVGGELAQRRRAAAPQRAGTRRVALFQRLCACVYCLLAAALPSCPNPAFAPAFQTQPWALLRWRTRGARRKCRSKYCASCPRSSSRTSGPGALTRPTWRLTLPAPRRTLWRCLSCGFLLCGSGLRSGQRAFPDARAPLRSSVMSPELRLGADSSISTVTSITDVIVTGDLQIAKIYVSFFGARVWDTS